MSCSVSNVRLLVGASLVAMCASVAAAGDEAIAHLHCRAASGGAFTGAQPGQHFSIRIDIESELPIEFNSALFRLVFTAENVAISDYEWDLPFTTGGASDFSLLGMQLPSVVTAGSLAGPGYPIDVIDAEFGNFLFVGTHGTGTILEVDCIMPPRARPGDEFFIVAAPDTFANGFIEFPTDAGTVLTVRTTSSPDIDGDGLVGAVDLAILLGSWSTPSADLTGDGDTNAADLALLLGAWE